MKQPANSHLSIMDTAKIEDSTNSAATPAAEVASEDWLLIGRVVGAHGLNGHVKIYPETDFPERLVKPGKRWIQKPGAAQPSPIRITSGRFLEGKNNYLVKLEGIDFRDQAEDLRSAQLMVPASDRLPLNPGEFHVGDLIGLSAVLQAEQTVLGTITNIFTTGHDLLEVTIETPQPDESEQESGHGEVDNNEQTATDPSSAQPLESKESNPSLRAKAAQKLRRKAKRQQKKKKPKTLLIPFVEDIVPVVDIAGGRIEITPPPGLINL